MIILNPVKVFVIAALRRGLESGIRAASKIFGGRFPTECPEWCGNTAG
jgi:hypothetical protein